MMNLPSAICHPCWRPFSANESSSLSLLHGNSILTAKYTMYVFPCYIHLPITKKGKNEWWEKKSSQRRWKILTRSFYEILLQPPPGQHRAFSTLTLFHSLIISPFSLLHIVPFTTSSWWQRGIGGCASELLCIIIHGIVSLLCLRMECIRIGQVVNSTFGTPACAFDPASKVSFPFYSYHASQHHIISKHTSPSTSPLVLLCQWHFHHPPSKFIMGVPNV